MITIRLDGDPIGKGRPRFNGKSGRVYTPEKTRSYESAMRIEAQHIMGGRPPLTEPLRVAILAEMSVPEGWAPWKKQAALLGVVRPTTKPDFDNQAKAIDGMNGVVWVDDARIVDVTFAKVYSERPGLTVEVEPVSGAAPAQITRRDQLPVGQVA